MERMGRKIYGNSVLFCSIILFIYNGSLRAPGWLHWFSIQLLVLAQVTISQSREFKSRVWLCADSTEPAWDALSLSLSALPPLTPLLSLSLKISKLKKNNNKDASHLLTCQPARYSYQTASVQFSSFAPVPLQGDHRESLCANVKSTPRAWTAPDRLPGSVREVRRNGLFTHKPYFVP